MNPAPARRGWVNPALPKREQKKWKGGLKKKGRAG